MWKWIAVLCIASTALAHAEIKVLAFAGSTREDSVNKKLILEATAFARQQGARVTFVDLKDYPMPLYDADLESTEGMPVKAKEFRKLMIQSEVIMIASPDYNGSISAVLKNTLDWASRGENGGGSRDAFKGKKFVIMSASPGAGGGAKGLTHLRSILEHIGGTVLPKQIVVPNAYQAFDDEGHLKDNTLKSNLKALVQQAVAS